MRKEITNREILASICIIAVMLILGLLIGNKIAVMEADNNARYNKTLKIDTQELFEYGMKTNVGDAFVYGTLFAVDPVTLPELDNEYMIIEKVKEKYTKHTRLVAHTTTDSDGSISTYYTEEEYWTWDYQSQENFKSTTISFCGVEFPIDKIKVPSTSHLTTIYESTKIRYIYYVTDTEYEGTIFTTLKDNTINDTSDFYSGYDIEHTLNILQSNILTILFWIGWIILTVGLVWVFYMLENDWLE